ncbi:cytochrome P450 [Streptomyces sp. NPDC051976]|uniref:cytochrome P450 n=1 Tax=Streptomyces sp. NPDC051976 TaxID=3154947 RepID=UPI0034448BE6
MTLWDNSRAWLVARHAEQVALLRDPRVSADNIWPRYPHVSQGLKDVAPINRTYMNLDGPEHRAHRRNFTGEFTSRRMQALKPRITQHIQNLLDAMEAKGGPVDLVTEFALPLPSLAISELLGVPYDDHEFFQDRTTAFVSNRSTPEQTVQAAQDLASFIGQLLEQKVAEPGDDMLSRMATNLLLNGKVPQDDVVQQARLMLVAGHETVAATLAMGVCALLTNPEQFALVRDADDETATKATEELLRYVSVVHKGRRRVAVEDIEIAGTLIPAGDGIILPIETANRDPRVFEDPDALDVTRDARAHLAFGSGPHQCLGASLARLELELAFPALLRRFPALKLDVPLDELRFRNDMAVYGVHNLPVTW